MLTGPGLFQELESSWKELANGSGSASPFQTWEWQSTWYRHYGAVKKPVAYAFYEGEDLVGLYPMVRGYGLYRTLRPMGIGPSDYLHPLIREGYGSTVAPLLAEELANTREADLVDLHQLRETTPLASQRLGSPIEQATCLLLDLPASFDDYLQSIGKSLRYDVRRLDKDLFKSQRATIERANEESLGRVMDAFFELHQTRWKKRGQFWGGAFLGRASAFHRDWVQQAARKGWLWLSLLKVDGEPVGAIYAMTLGATVYYYQAGFDPSKGSISPGTLLVAGTIRRAIEEGKQHFDFMRGDEPYKRRWKPQHSLRNLRFITPARGVLGRLGSQWNRTGSRLESKVRARLEGRGLL